ncbi:MAG: methylated-DNA--[protein]-cysteine S-methyltransferase [Microbacteriaceae bacterium]|jgi:methylated-DNA-[protein]-cysteine S-methyltransferase|nr:methylated-DNA--[protein]-cysteine S-methyltransferase [Microbacteriaceae bacterium]MCI1207031.1 methylated-DNA--[protein]-cysteine S-methyltransferase [Microbacteriaceae bacterium]
MLMLEMLSSPVGEVSCLTGPAGVVRIICVQQGDPVEPALSCADRLGESVRRATMGPCASQLREYFRGERRAFDLPLDLRLVPGTFHRRALRMVETLHWGECASYGEIAALAGSPGAARAVGAACAENPVPFVIPCHRVVRADGRLGSFGGRPELQRWLLSREGASWVASTGSSLGWAVQGRSRRPASG